MNFSAALSTGSDMRPRSAIAAVLMGSIGIAGCGEPLGPYQYRDKGDTLRIGGDFLGMVRYRPGPANERLQPPKLLYPRDGMVFSHYPRELTYRWEPTGVNPQDVEYLFESD